MNESILFYTEGHRERERERYIYIYIVVLIIVQLMYIHSSYTLVAVVYLPLATQQYIHNAVWHIILNPCYFGDDGSWY